MFINNYAFAKHLGEREFWIIPTMSHSIIPAKNLYIYFQVKVIRELGTSTEKIPLPDWPGGKSVVHFLY